MKETKIYTREDIRNLWRRYQRGDMSAGNDFVLIAHAQGQTPKTFQAEIERECREEDEQMMSNANTRATPEQRKRAGVLLWEKAKALKQRQPELSNWAAFRLALLDNPALAERYTGFLSKETATCQNLPDRKPYSRLSNSLRVRFIASRGGIRACR